ncbi:MAG: hypothetical protein KAV82_01770 [Phycisphaerae bacterium]|nr:hypothetical protein [Phycisphaerae bacterium]
MNQRRLRRLAMGAVLACGCLFAGPCGVTTLQFQDFLTSAVIRTSVTTLASLLEVATIEQAQSESQN